MERRGGEVRTLPFANMRRLKEIMIFQIANLVDQRQLVPLRHLLGLVGQVGHIGQVDQVDQVNDNDMFASTTEE